MSARWIVGVGVLGVVGLAISGCPRPDFTDECEFVCIPPDTGACADTPLEQDCVDTCVSRTKDQSSKCGQCITEEVDYQDQSCSCDMDGYCTKCVNSQFNQDCDYGQNICDPAVDNKCLGAQVRQINDDVCFSVCRP